MLADTQDTRYFERMASSLGDKRHLLDWLEGDHVLDVGAGGGELAEAMRLTGRSVWALDGSHAAASRMKANFPKLSVLTGLAHEVGYLAPQEHFDTVVCSSIFHEVYSYGVPETGPYSIEAFSLTLTALRDSMVDGGRLVIRDGIMPTEWDKPVKLTFTDTVDADAFWNRYRSAAPFATWHGGQRTVDLQLAADGTYEGTLESAMEFLYTYTWGWDSAPREMKELYGVFTEAEYRDFITAHGFEVEVSAQYVQPGYHEHLKNAVGITDADGVEVPLPSTNFILVARKR